MVVFKFINCYVSLYYIAFLKDPAAHENAHLAGRNALSWMETPTCGSPDRRAVEGAFLLVWRAHDLCQ